MPDIPETGKMISSTAMESKHGLKAMAPNTKVSINSAKSTATASIPFPTDQRMKASGEATRFVAAAPFYGSMDESTLVSLRTTICMATAYTFMVTVHSTLDNFSMTKRRGSVYTSGRTSACSKAGGTAASSTASGHI